MAKDRIYPALARSIVIVLLLFTVVMPTRAQQPASTCKTLFVPYVLDEHLGLLPLPGWTSDQGRWFNKKGQKKYPMFCVDGEEARYVFVTARWTVPVQRTTDKTRTAYATGPVTSVIGITGSSPGHPGQPIWATQVSTFVTTWQEQQTEIVHEPRALLVVFEVESSEPLSSGTQLRPQPIIQAVGTGRNAGRDALQFVLKNWNMRLTDKSQ